MRVGIIGDLHGLPISPELQRAIEISEPDFLLQAGDIWNACTIEWPRPLYFIWGNHEICENMKIPNTALTAGLHNIMGISIVALPSIPMPGDKPGPALYTQDDYNKCLLVHDHVDIFISHGCGYPFWVYVKGEGKRINVEDRALTHLIRKLKPSYAVSGHNHLYEKTVEEGITLVRLGAENQNAYDMLFFDG